MLWYTISLPYSCCISGNILVSLYLCIPITYFSLLPSVSRRQSKIPASVRLIHRLWCSQAEFVAVLSQNPGPSTAINIFTATSTWPRTPQGSCCTPMATGRDLEKGPFPTTRAGCWVSRAPPCSPTVRFCISCLSWFSQGFLVLLLQAYLTWHCFVSCVFSPKPHDRAQ